MTFTRIAAAAFAACLFATAASAATFPNSIKYKDTGVPNAVAVTTVASIEARALLNRNDTTDVEITTGSFEGDAPSGYVSKVKIGIPTADGVLPVNFNHAESATFSGNITGVISGNVVTIDAQVRGLNQGTDHASAQAKVAKRPDLNVLFVSTPSFPVKGRIARVRTAISEMNGQMGARATARLLIDGVEVDRAENIWVNAGGRVNVTFAPVLDAEDGQHDFTVVVDHVNPRDWDDSNNTLTENRRVYNLIDEFYNWTATASESEFDEYDYQKRPWFEQTRTGQGVNQSFRFEGTILALMQLETLTATASGVSDGNPLFSGSVTGMSIRNTPVGTRCASSRSGNPDVVVCYNPNTNVIDVDIDYGAGDATYRSWGWATRQHPFAPEEPMFTWDTTFQEDTVQSRFGSTVSLTYTLTDGTNTWTANPFIGALTSTSSFSHVPYACNYDDFTNETVCREQRNSTSTRTGSTSGAAQ